MADTVAASGLSSYMVALEEADTSAFLSVIRNTQHHNALLATKPALKWHPRSGRNAQYAQFEEHLRSVARAMGIKYEVVGHAVAPQQTESQHATRNAEAQQDASAAALAAWQVESTRLFDHALTAIDLSGMYQEDDRETVHSFESAPLADGHALVAWLRTFAAARGEALSAEMVQLLTEALDDFDAPLNRSNGGIALGSSQRRLEQIHRYTPQATTQLGGTAPPRGPTSTLDGSGASDHSMAVVEPITGGADDAACNSQPGTRSGGVSSGMPAPCERSLSVSGAIGGGALGRAADGSDAGQLVAQDNSQLLQQLRSSVWGGCSSGQLPLKATVKGLLSGNANGSLSGDARVSNARNALNGLLSGDARGAPSGFLTGHAGDLQVDSFTGDTGDAITSSLVDYTHSGALGSLITPAVDSLLGSADGKAFSDGDGANDGDVLNSLISLALDLVVGATLDALIGHTDDDADSFIGRSALINNSRPLASAPNGGSPDGLRDDGSLDSSSHGTLNGCAEGSVDSCSLVGLAEGGEDGALGSLFDGQLAACDGNGDGSVLGSLVTLTLGDVGGRVGSALAGALGQHSQRCRSSGLRGRTVPCAPTAQRALGDDSFEGCDGRDGDEPDAPGVSFDYTDGGSGDAPVSASHSSAADCSGAATSGGDTAGTGTATSNEQATSSDTAVGRGEFGSTGPGLASMGGTASVTCGDGSLLHSPLMVQHGGGPHYSPVDMADRYVCSSLDGMQWFQSIGDDLDDDVQLLRELGEDPELHLAFDVCDEWDASSH